MTRNLSRRQFLAGLAVVGGSMVLAACAAPGAPANPTTAAPAGGQAQPQAGQVQTIRALHRGGKAQVDELQMAIDKYNKQFANKYQAKMEFHEGSGYNEKVLSLVAAKSLPDVLYMNAEVLPSFAVRGAFADLNQFRKSDKSVEDYWPELLEMSAFEGKLYGLPKDYSPYVAWLNHNRFKEAGLDLPKAGWTWDDFRSLAQKLTVKQGNRTEKWGSYIFASNYLTWIWQAGGDVFDKDYKKVTITEPAAMKGLQFAADLAMKDQVTPIAQGITESGQNQYQWFGTGRIAMFLMGRWAVPDLRQLKDLEWSCIPLPKGQQEANVLLQSGPTVGAQSTQLEAAWEFCKIWTGPDGQQINVDTGVSVPPVKSDKVRDAYLNKTPPSKESNQVFYDAIKIGHVLPTTGKFSWLEVNQVLQPETDLLWQGKQSVEDTVKKVAPKLEELIKKA